jgi:hypothetical protein
VIHLVAYNESGATGAVFAVIIASIHASFSGKHQIHMFLIFNTLFAILYNAEDKNKYINKVFCLHALIITS